MGVVNYMPLLELARQLCFKTTLKRWAVEQKLMENYSQLHKAINNKNLKCVHTTLFTGSTYSTRNSENLH